MIDSILAKKPVRSRTALFSAAALIVAAGAFFLLFSKNDDPAAESQAGRADARPQEAAVSDAQPSAKPITIRNLTRNDLEYAVRHIGKSGDWETRVLPPGSIDRFEVEDLLEINYMSEDIPIFNTVEPGNSYTFRYGNGDRVKIFLGSHGREDAEDLAPFVPTPMPVVQRMLEMAGVGPEDIVYDIGCGDGRIVIEAAKTFGARGVGIEIDPELYEMSKANAATAGVDHLIEFLNMDATRVDISAATVVTIYLLPESNELLRPIFEAQLKPGAVVVSHNYAMDRWADRRIGFETVLGEHEAEHYIFVYRW